MLVMLLILKSLVESLIVVIIFFVCCFYLIDFEALLKDLRKFIDWRVDILGNKTKLKIAG